MKFLNLFNLFFINAFDWIKKLASQDKTASTKRTAFLLVVVSSILWLSYNLYVSGISELWVTSFQTLLASVGISYVGGYALEKKSQKKKIEEEDESDN